jgi:hypothetical protein
MKTAIALAAIVGIYTLAVAAMVAVDLYFAEES